MGTSMRNNFLEQLCKWAVKSAARTARTVAEQNAAELSFKADVSLFTALEDDCYLEWLPKDS